MRGAEKLVAQGWARALLIHAYNQVAYASDSGLGAMEKIFVAPVADKPVKFMGWSYRVFENTHLEMIKGKKLMDKLGYRSAIKETQKRGQETGSAGNGVRETGSGLTDGFFWRRDYRRCLSHDAWC